MDERYEQKDTIIYGGAFNPPTRAHQAILQACVDMAHQTNADVWLLPSGDRSDKTIEASRSKRLEMLRVLVRDIVADTVSISIQETEIDRKVQTETFDTVQEFNESYPDRRFVWVFGSDSVQTMPQWHGGEWMLDQLPMLIVDRPGSPIASLGRCARLLAVNSINTSSTEVRRRIELQESIDELVSPRIRELLLG